MSVCFFTDELFAFAYTFMNEHSNQKRTNTKKTRKKAKKTRKKHEVLRIFRLTEAKISGLNWTTESKGSK